MRTTKTERRARNLNDNCPHQIGTRQGGAKSYIDRHGEYVVGEPKRTRKVRKLNSGGGGFKPEYAGQEKVLKSERTNIFKRAGKFVSRMFRNQNR